jgi:MFS family permease
MESVATPVLERRLVRVVGAIVFVDTLFYAAIAPLLPSLAHQLHLSKLSAGVMTASYPVGTLLGSIPGGVLAARAGPKAAVCTGLSLLGVSTLAFGFLDSAPLLDLARLIEGIGGACSWTGGIAWLVAEAPADRRGGLIGNALGAAIAGALFGPVLGTLASAVGRGPAFSAVVVCAIVLIDQARRLPSLKAASPQGVGHLLRAVRDRGVLIGMWLVALPSIASGVINVLGPLRLHSLGASTVAIGAVFLVATALEASITPMVGRMSDRLGRRQPLRYGLAGATVALLCFTLPQTVVLLGVVMIATITALAAFWAPAMAMLSDVAHGRGVDQALAAALMNLAWASGQVVGSGVGGAVAKTTGDGVPVTMAAGLCAITLLWLMRSGARDPVPT